MRIRFLPVLLACLLVVSGAGAQPKLPDTGISGVFEAMVGVDDADYRAEARFVAGRIGKGGLLGQIASCRPEDDAGFEAWLDALPDDARTITQRRVASVRTAG